MSSFSPSPPQRSVALISLGCAKNLVDSECMLGILDQASYRLVSRPQEADIIIVNTCAFIEAAKTEAIEHILEMAEWKKKGRLSCLVVAGCLAQRYATEIASELPEVDIILGTTAISRIVRQIEHHYERQAGEEGPVIDAAYRPAGVLEHLDGPRLLSTGVSAYLKIAEGCSNHCTFCAIPAIRGPYRSRTMDSVLREAEELCAGDVGELTLVAQDTTRYGLDTEGKALLPQLLAELERNFDFIWIRFLYAYPEGVTDELLQVLANSRRIVPYLDLPIQHASDSLLRRMGRRLTTSELRALFAKIRNQLPEAILRTTVLLGFPGEEEEDVLKLLDFIREVEFDHLGAFVYSPEEGTAACRLPGQLPQELAAERAARVMECQQQISLKRRRSTIGDRELVLIEGSTEDGLFYCGRSRREAPESDGFIAVASEVELEIGSFCHPVRIVDASAYERTGVFAP
ncbi:MAG: 30S ribosomal protein S12 methylthiotransferase RimO [Bacillota bacterium]|nr:30S ribosomal protein S12 methylthiotransferase RimO [Bacillota bacterium]